MNIYESITKIMEDGYSITKAKKNQTQGFMYRGIDDVLNTFYPLLSKYHVFVTPEVIERDREERTTKNGSSLIYTMLTIKYTFYAEDGTSVSATVIGEGMDSGDKSSNKALAVGMKYAFFQVFCIPTEEFKDPDAECHQVMPVAGTEDKDGFTDLGVIKAAYKGENLKKLLESNGVIAIEDLPPEKIKALAKFIRDKAAAKK